MAYKQSPFSFYDKESPMNKNGDPKKKKADAAAATARGATIGAAAGTMGSKATNVVKKFGKDIVSAAKAGARAGAKKRK